MAILAGLSEGYKGKDYTRDHHEGRGAVLGDSDKLPVNIILEHNDIFPAWHASDTAKLYTPVFFENKKKSGGYWF